MSAPIDQHLWDKALAQLRTSVDEESYATWLSPTHIHQINGEMVVLSVPSSLYKSWLSSNYRDKILSALKAVTDQDYILDFYVDPNSEADSSPPEISLINSTPEAQPATPLYLPKSSILNPKYQFDRFVVGESNRFAHAACRQVADPTSKSYNPLFIYGGVGLGKTHLMHAIGHQFTNLSPNPKVLYVTSEQFMNSFVDSINQGKQFEFREHYRKVDLLMIDDVQFFSGKTQTQVEFFHTFNALYDAGKKIVVSSDRPPKELTTLEDRLRTRFSWGLVVDVIPPDLETRIAILRRKAMEENVELPNDVTMYIAERVQANIRELEGVLVRLRAYAHLQEQTISLQLAKEVLGHLLDSESDAPTDIEDVIEAICAYFEIKRVELLGSSRLKKYSTPRHICQYLSRKLTNLSYPDIGQKFGGRDHTSVLHAYKKVEKEMESDENLRNLVSYLSRKIQGAGGS